MNSGASRNSTRNRHTPISRACASRSCQCARGFAPAIRIETASAAAVLILCEHAHAVRGQPQLESRALGKPQLVDAVARDVDQQRLILRAGKRHGDVAKGAEELDLGYFGV